MKPLIIAGSVVAVLIAISVAQAKKIETPIGRVKYIVDYLCEGNTYPTHSDKNDPQITAGQTI